MEQVAQTSKQYSLDFLKTPEEDFRSKMVDYIKTNFAHVLDQQDLALLENADDMALSTLSQKWMQQLRPPMNQ